jgi:hypothetical protein
MNKLVIVAAAVILVVVLAGAFYFGSFGGPAPLNVKASISASGMVASVGGIICSECGSDTKYTINWGEGPVMDIVPGTSTLSHLYLTAGNYLVTVVAYSGGHSGSYSQSVVVPTQ